MKYTIQGVKAFFLSWATWICAAGVPGVAAVPVCSVSVSGLWGGRHRGRLRWVPDHPAWQHHAHGPGAWTDMETTAGTFDRAKPKMFLIIQRHIYVTPHARSFNVTVVSDPPGCSCAQIPRPRQASDRERHSSCHLWPLQDEPQRPIWFPECEGHISRPVLSERWLSVSGAQENPQVSQREGGEGHYTKKIHTKDSGSAEKSPLWQCFKQNHLRNREGKCLFGGSANNSDTSRTRKGASARLLHLNFLPQKLTWEILCHRK